MRNTPDDPALTDYEDRLSPAGAAPVDGAAEATARLDRALDKGAETGSSEPPPSAAEDMGPERKAPGKKRGPKPGAKSGKKRGRPVGSGKRAKPAPEPVAQPRGEPMKSRAEYQSEIDRLEREVEQLRDQHRAPTPEELQDITESLEGLIITGQMVMVNVIGAHAVLTDDQQEKLVRIWSKPMRRLQRFISEQMDSPTDEMPSWVIGTLQTLLVAAGTVAILWPNWRSYRDQQPVNETGQRTDVAAADLAGKTSLDFPRPRGAE